LATPPPIPLRAVFAAIWNGIAEVFVRLRRPVLTALTIYLAFAILDVFIEPDRSLLRSIPEGIRDVLLVPFSLAIFRLLILGEVASHYRFETSSPRFQRLAVWTIGLWLWISVILPLAMELFPVAHGIQIVATIVLIILSIAFIIRIAILFPAFAVDASGATISNALADTRDRNWFILKAFFVTFVPTLLTMLLLGTLVALGSASHLTGFSHWSSLPWLVLVSLVGFVTYVAIAVTAARLYGWLGEAVKAGARG
jgi:hypothetical protein